MSTSQLICVAAVGLFVLVMSPIAGWTVALISGYVITLGGITTTLYSTGAVTQGHYGIARNAPTLWLGDLLLIGTLLAIWAGAGRLRIGWLIASLTFPAIVLLFVVWGNTPEQWSGLKLYVTAIVAFGVGRWLSENLTEKAGLVLVSACLASCALQFTVTFAQSRGVYLLGLASSDSAQWINDGRMVGLYSHPAFLGKTMFLLFCFLLPLTLSSHALTRRLAYAALGFGSVATLLTLSRANTFAIGVAIVLWVFLSGRASSLWRRLAIVGVALGLVFMNSAAVTGLQLRQAEDPTGGFRDRIMDVGLEQIKSAPLTGTGPNYYGEIVGQYDRLAASGFPLHNSFLYPAAELGIPLAIALFLPLIATVWAAAARFARQRSLDVQSAALFAILPGLVAIAWTGWGMVATEALPLWFMGFGFLAARSDPLTTAKMRDANKEPIKRPASSTKA